MEYYLCRAMEVARLTEDEFIRLQNHEKKGRYFKDWDNLNQTFGNPVDRTKRTLMPFEIQDCLKLKSSREIWGVPDHEQAQSAHSQRLRSRLDALKIAPKHDFHNSQVDLIHEFDSKVRDSVAGGEIDFAFQYTGSNSRGRVKDSL